MCDKCQEETSKKVKGAVQRWWVLGGIFPVCRGPLPWEPLKAGLVWDI